MKRIRQPESADEDGDSGLSGRVYSMLAKEMSDTRNRGRIVWVFATSRPDLLEVDLKRQGRLDVHIPLFPPANARRNARLLLSVAKKLRFPMMKWIFRPFPKELYWAAMKLKVFWSGALRLFELQTEPRPPCAISLKECSRKSVRTPIPANSNTWT